MPRHLFLLFCWLLPCLAVAQSRVAVEEENTIYEQRKRSDRKFKRPKETHPSADHRAGQAKKTREKRVKHRQRAVKKNRRQANRLRNVPPYQRVPPEAPVRMATMHPSAEGADKQLFRSAEAREKVRQQALIRSRRDSPENWPVHLRGKKKPRAATRQMHPSAAAVARRPFYKTLEEQREARQRLSNRRVSASQWPRSLRAPAVVPAEPLNAHPSAAVMTKQFLRSKEEKEKRRKQALARSRKDHAANWPVHLRRGQRPDRPGKDKAPTAAAVANLPFHASAKDKKVYRKKLSKRVNKDRRHFWPRHLRASVRPQKRKSEQHISAEAAFRRPFFDSFEDREKFRQRTVRKSRRNRADNWPIYLRNPARPPKAPADAHPSYAFANRAPKPELAKRQQNRKKATRRRAPNTGVAPYQREAPAKPRYSAVERGLWYD